MGFTLSRLACICLIAGCVGCLSAETKQMAERREWVDKRSSRIWRGRMESRYWRYIKGLGGCCCGWQLAACLLPQK